jgi:hypothetical protein
MRRASAIISPTVSSATASLSTLGVLVTRMLRALGSGGVDAVVADAEIGDDLELGQLSISAASTWPPAIARTLSLTDASRAAGSGAS